MKKQHPTSSIDAAEAMHRPAAVTLPVTWRAQRVGVVRQNRLSSTRWQWMRRDENGHLIVGRRSYATPEDAAVALVLASGRAQGASGRAIALELLHGVRMAPRTTPVHPFASEVATA